MRLLLAVFLICLLIGCATTFKSTNSQRSGIAAESIPRVTLRPQLTEAERLEGQKLYTQDCGGCHELKNPADYTIARWEPILKRMFIKARVYDSTEMRMVRNYVLAGAKE